jgi:hypothetical protein
MKLYTKKDKFDFHDSTHKDKFYRYDVANEETFDWDDAVLENNLTSMILHTPKMRLTSYCFSCRRFLTKQK